MNLRNTCPDIADDWKGSVTDVCRLLGEDKPISPKTVRKHLQLGGIDAKRGANNRLQITGADVKRLWAIL